MTEHNPNARSDGEAMLSEKTRETIDHWVSKFPPDKKRSALIQSLLAAQEQNGGWITRELTEAVAEYLDLPPVWPESLLSRISGGNRAAETRIVVLDDSLSMDAEDSGRSVMDNAKQQLTDFAESLANYIHVVVDKRPYWVEVTRNGETLYRLESCWGTPRCATKEMFLRWLLAAPKKL